MKLTLSTLLACTAFISAAVCAGNSTKPNHLQADTAKLKASAHQKQPRQWPLSVSLGPRPYYLLEDMDAGPLKDTLQHCAQRKRQFRTSDFSIGHRGAPLQFPEHTRESYIAAARMGAGVIECDVTFTADRELVCRHSQCDLHTTTNILETPLAQKCSQNFQPAVFDPDTGALLQAASARCCTSDITLAEFKTLQGKMDGANPAATRVSDYLQGTASWRTDGYAARGTLLTHRESIDLIQQLGAKFTPELKAPQVPMPYQGEYTQADYAQQMIDEYRAAGIPAHRVFAQSFNLQDVLYWISHAPDFGRHAVYLDGRYDDPSFDHNDATTHVPSMAALAAQGVRTIAPPMWMLLDVNDQEDIVASRYAQMARAAGLDIIAWTFERSAPLTQDGAWYHQTTDRVINNDGDKYQSLDVLARQVGVKGVFSDWPASVTFYANCMNLH